MPKGIYNHNKITGENNPAKRLDVKEKIGLANTGRKFSDEHKRKIKEAKMGSIPWNKGLTKENDERIKSISNNLSILKKGKQVEHLKKYNFTSENMKGKPKSEDWKMKASNTRINKGLSKGELNPMYGKFGEKHPNWLGGKSFEPYTLEFNKAFKLAIKQRDGFMCLKCGMREEDSKQLFQKGLIIHHIDYIKENTTKENCCALCNRCHSEVNFNRNSWIKFFQSLLSERYGYQYSENGEIIISIKDAGGLF